MPESGEAPASALPTFSSCDGLDRSWRLDAACHEVATAAFFGSERAAIPPEEIAELCDRCPVRDPCLEFAFATHAKGIWGGTTERQRRGGRRRSTAA